MLLSTDALTLIIGSLTESVVVPADEDATATTGLAKRLLSEGACVEAAAATGGGRVAEAMGGDRAAAAVLSMRAWSGAPGSTIADRFTREADVDIEER